MNVQASLNSVGETVHGLAELIKFENGRVSMFNWNLSICKLLVLRATVGDFGRLMGLGIFLFWLCFLTSILLSCYSYGDGLKFKSLSGSLVLSYFSISFSCSSNG